MWRPVSFVSLGMCLSFMHLMIGCGGAPPVQSPSSDDTGRPPSDAGIGNTSDGTLQIPEVSGDGPRAYVRYLTRLPETGGLSLLSFWANTQIVSDDGHRIVVRGEGTGREERSRGVVYTYQIQFEFACELDHTLRLMCGYGGETYNATVTAGSGWLSQSWSFSQGGQTENDDLSLPALSMGAGVKGGLAMFNCATGEIPWFYLVSDGAVYSSSRGVQMELQALDLVWKDW